MAKYVLRDKALAMRKLGMSYSQIKEKVKVSKSTLSLWLRPYPLSRERINELRGWSERRIERCRETKQRHRSMRIQGVYEKLRKDIGLLSERELFIAGLFLYWAEGTKASPGTVYLTNTDPAMLLFFIEWLEQQGVPRSRLRARLHLYADMDINKETLLWVKILGLPKSAFRKPYIKESFKDKRQNYKGRFGHGTCNLFFYNRDLYEKVMMGMQYVRGMYGGNGFTASTAI